MMTEHAFPHTEPVNARPLPMRRGRLGLCTSCHTPVAEHFNTEGSFVGCPAAEPDTVFLLVAYNGQAIDPGRIGRQPAPVSPPPRVRRFARARYFPAPLPAGKTVEALDLTDNRRRTLRALHALHSKGYAGALSREIERKSGLPHGAVTESIAWLQAQHLALAVEDGSEPPPTDPTLTKP